MSEIHSHPRYLRYAIDLVREHTYEDHLEYHLASVIVAGGNILSTGYNSSKVTSFIRTFGLPRNHMHAECDAILSARNKIDLNGAKLYVARLTVARGNIANSKPCDLCRHAAGMYGIKRIFYTVDNSTFAVMKP